MKVLTDLTQRVSAGLAIGEQHYETGINTEPPLACQDWLPLGNGSASSGGGQAVCGQLSALVRPVGIGTGSE